MLLILTFNLSDAVTVHFRNSQITLEGSIPLLLAGPYMILQFLSFCIWTYSMDDLALPGLSCAIASLFHV